MAHASASTPRAATLLRATTISSSSRCSRFRPSRADAGLDRRRADDAVFGVLVASTTRVRRSKPRGNTSRSRSWARRSRCSDFCRFFGVRCRRAAAAPIPGRDCSPSRPGAAGADADRVPADPGRLWHEGRSRAAAHLAAGRAQPGAVAGLRAALRHRDDDARSTSSCACCRLRPCRRARRRRGRRPRALFRSASPPFCCCRCATTSGCSLFPPSSTWASSLIAAGLGAAAAHYGAMLADR